MAGALRRRTLHLISKCSSVSQNISTSNIVIQSEYSKCLTADWRSCDWFNTGYFKDILGYFTDLPKTLGRHKPFGNLQKPYEYFGSSSETLRRL